MKLCTFKNFYISLLDFMTIIVLCIGIAIIYWTYENINTSIYENNEMNINSVSVNKHTNGHKLTKVNGDDIISICPGDDLLLKFDFNRKIATNNIVERIIENKEKNFEVVTSTIFKSASTLSIGVVHIESVFPIPLSFNTGDSAIAYLKNTFYFKNNPISFIFPRVIYSQKIKIKINDQKNC